ncbi:MAG TPA: PDZ domain-containing protein [Gemmatimonadaceae bacterium]|nr:PDZ domain-containing protein [Gemmatimonadaceae bacterium]
MPPSFRAALLLLSAIARALGAQQPFSHFSESIEARYSHSDPIVSYVLRVDSADLTGFDVELRLRNAGDTIRLAMAKHPEYDDRFFRYVENLRVEGARGANITRVDSAVWRLVAPGGEAAVRYRIHVPPSPTPRAAWRPFLSATGGLVGGPHSFIYVVGRELAPAYLRLELPNSWRIATALRPTADRRTFFAPSVHVLVESPVLAGQLRQWLFMVDAVPHRVAYWALPNATPFDTSAFVLGVEQLTRQAIAIFGRAPWPDYSFLFQDGAYGALEHPASVTLGAPSTSLAEGIGPTLAETAHEFFHAWNLMRIRPAEYQGVDYRPPVMSRGLWFSEGLSMYYADLLLRRAHLPVRDSTRVIHLENLISRYLSNAAYAHFSPEEISRAAYATRPDALGDYDAGVHIPGELIGAMLDLAIRDATDGRRSSDDLMRAMLDRFSGQRGFTSADVERTVHDVCSCDVHSFFNAHVRGSTPIDFARYLRLAGFRLEVQRIPAERDNRPVPDIRLRAWIQPSDSTLRLLLFTPVSVWGRAGLHSGDRLLAVNGAPMVTPVDFRSVLERVSVGDTVRIEVARSSGTKTATVVVTGYDRVAVRILPDSQVTERQRRLRERWMSGAR